MSPLRSSTRRRPSSFELAGRRAERAVRLILRASEASAVRPDIGGRNCAEAAPSSRTRDTAPN